MLDLRRIFLEPKSLDEDAGRREYILNVILVGSIVMLLILDAQLLYDSIYHAAAHESSISGPLFSIFPAFFILLYALSRRGFFVLASYLLIGAYFIGNSYAAYQWGVNMPTALVGYALLIVIASILISPRFAFFVALAVGLFVLPLWYAQLHSLTFTEAEQFTDGDGVAIVILYSLITLVAWLSNREIEKSLERARISERALKEERDSLEAKVAERTRELLAAELEKIDHLYRFAEFGQLASGLFHDLLNMLQTFSLQAESKQAESSDILQSTHDIQNEIGRFRDAFRKQLSRDDVCESFSLSAGVGNVLQFLSYQAKREGIRLEFERSDDFMYFGSPLKFHQVVMNLVLNAIEAFGPGQEQKQVMVRLDNSILTVTDSGSGIPADVLGKIFDPFFTTKQGEKQGTGIGLAITKRIVEKDFGGSIEACNGENGGAVFVVRFPMSCESKQVISSDQVGGTSYQDTVKL